MLNIWLIIRFLYQTEGCCNAKDKGKYLKTISDDKEKFFLNAPLHTQTSKNTFLRFK